MASARWTPEDVRKNAKSWNLEGDSQLLELMKSISDNLLKRGNTTTNNVNKMCISLEKSSIAFENASNKLSALSKTQFVENRVYDDDEIKTKRDNEVEKTTKVYNPNETIKIILSNNLKMLENCYEKVSVELDDSEEEDEQAKSTVIYRPKNLYGKRLPALIGSKEWYEKWHIGLIDSDDESLSEKGSLREEFSDDSAENISLPSIGRTISESGSSVWSINRILPITVHTRKLTNFDPSSDEEAISSNTFVSKTSSEDTRKISDKGGQLAEQQYYIHKPKEKSLVDSSDSGEDIEKGNIQTQTLPKYHNLVFAQKKSQILPKISNIISDEPPELDFEENYKKSSKNFINESLGSDVEQNISTNDNSRSLHKNNLISRENSSVQNESINKTDKKTVNLFDDNDLDSFMKEINEKASNKTMKTNLSKKVNLFNSDSECESIKPDEIYDHAETLSSNSTSTMIYADKVQSKNEPIKVENNNEKRDLVKYNNNPKGLFDDFDEDGDLFLPVKSENNKHSGFLSSALLSKTKISNLFDDQPPEDDFDNLFESSKLKDPKTNDNSSNNSFIKNKTEPNIDAQLNVKKDVIENNLRHSEKELYNVDVSPEDNDFRNEIKSSYNTKAISLNRKNLASDLFSSDWSDDEENIFSTKEAQKPNIDLGKQEKSSDNNKNEKPSIKQKNNAKSIISPHILPIDFNILSCSNLKTKSWESDMLSADHLSKKKEAENQSNIQVSNEENREINEKSVNEISKVFPKENSKSNESTSLIISPLIFNNNKDKKKFADLNEGQIEGKTFDINEVSTENICSTEGLDMLKTSSENQQNEEIKQLDEGVSEILDGEIPNNANESEIILDVTVKENSEDASQHLSIKNKNSNISKENAKDIDKIEVKNDLYSLLFSDIPPEDEQVFAKAGENTTIIEPVVRDLQEINKGTSLNSYNNTHIGLFDDFPPDDCIDDIKKHPDNLFNEEFESALEVRFDGDIQSNYMISEEPPPDDYFKENIDSISFNNNCDFKPISTQENLNSPSEKKKIGNNPEIRDLKNVSEKKTDENQTLAINSVSLLISAHDQSLEQVKNNVTVSEKFAQKPKKLKPILGGTKKIYVSKNSDETDSVLKIANELNINVAALLPGAKKPLKTKSSNKKNEHVEVAETNKVVILGNPNNITDEGKLIGLNKSRAKILVKRRPSTRKARQESYRKSRGDNDSRSDSEKESKPTIVKPVTVIRELKNKDSDSFLEEITPKTNIKESFKNIQLDTVDIAEVKNQILFEDALQNSNLMNRKKLKEDNALFPDSNDDDSEGSDWFNKLSLNTKSSSSQIKSDKNKKILVSDNIFNDIEQINTKPFFKQPKTNIAHDDIFNDLAPHMNKPKSISNNNYKQQVPELNFNDMDSNSEPYRNSYSSILQKNNNIKSFVEHLDNDDDDLFSSPFVKVISAQTPNTIITNLNKKPHNEKKSYDEDNNEIFKKVKIRKQLSEVLSTQDQSDISNTANTAISNNKSKGLFSSEDDDDDDDSLFGGNITSGNSKKKIHDQKTEKIYSVLKDTKSVHEHKTRESLFDDLDDDEDDDLFGTSKTPKVTMTSKIISKTQPSRGAIPKRPLEKKMTKIQDNNNPLADLLDQ